MTQVEKKREQTDEKGADLVLGQQSRELALLQDDHVLLYSSDLRRHTLKHDLLTPETQSNVKALSAGKPDMFNKCLLESQATDHGSDLTCWTLVTMSP